MSVLPTVDLIKNGLPLQEGATHGDRERSRPAGAGGGRESAFLSPGPDTLAQPEPLKDESLYRAAFSMFHMTMIPGMPSTPLRRGL
jgi:hypothetical protein